jgi:hypothetical protein
MKKRNFLSGLGSVGALPLLSFKGFSGKEQDTIEFTDVQIIKVRGEKESFDFSYQSQINPGTVYPEHKLPPYTGQKKVKPDTQSISNNYIKIITNKGVEGFYGAVDWKAASRDAFIPFDEVVKIEKLP